MIRHAIATILCFGVVGAIPTAFIATLGRQTGMRTMIISRYSSGYFGCTIYSFLNILTQYVYNIYFVIAYLRRYLQARILHYMRYPRWADAREHQPGHDTLDRRHHHRLNVFVSPMLYRIPDGPPLRTVCMDRDHHHHVHALGTRSQGRVRHQRAEIAGGHRRQFSCGRLELRWDCVWILWSKHDFCRPLTEG